MRGTGRTPAARRSPETWAVILAAGEGKRMRSGQPKVLHALGGRPLILHVLEAARAAGAEGIVVVVGRGGAAVRAVLAGEADVRLVEQGVPRGTGHALGVAREAVPASATRLLLLYGDVPLLTEATLRALLARHQRTRAAATVLTFVPAEPAGYGRVLRRHGRVRAIVEERDATPAQRRVPECNSGIYCFDPRPLWPVLGRVRPDNIQGELYLTSVIGLLARGGRRVEAMRVADPLEVAGVNDRGQLAELEGVVRRRTIARLMAAGVTVRDPATTYVDLGVTVGQDSVLEPGVRLTGRTTVGEGCVIGSGCQLTDMTVGDRVILRPYCVLEASRIEMAATLGPFARLRAGSVIEQGADIGNFIEIKKSVIGRRVKAHHVGYLGDATVGEEANIGAGTITCNYDGRRKHETRVGPRAFVGTNVSLVAPLTIGDGAYVGAGSVVTRDVPAEALAVERAPLVVREGWVRRRRAATGPAARTRPDGASPSPPGQGP